MASDILLSICIPTYNRAKSLDKTIRSIVQQKKFSETSDVEIVIADNCSDDSTEEVVQKYIGIYGDKIRYFRNSENIGAANIERVLSYGKGVFLKLNNDTLEHTDCSLNKISEVVYQNKNNKNILFFTNGTIKNISTVNCKDLDSFVKNVSFYSTWIACCGIWKEDFILIDNFKTIEKSLLINDVLFKLICLNRAILVDNANIFNSVAPANKGGYNIYRVFVTNYLGILEDYGQKGHISWTTLFNEKYRLFRYFLIPWTLKIWKDKTEFAFDKKGAFLIVFKKYWTHPIFYIGVVYLCGRLSLNKLDEKIVFKRLKILCN